MPLTSKKLPLPFRLLNVTGAALGAARLSSLGLEVDALLRAATQQTGLTDFGDPGFLDGLRVLVASAEGDAKLHVIGRFSIRQVAVDSLVNRLLLVEGQKRTPELFQHPLVPPLIVLGLPRSGTTYLHRLRQVVCKNSFSSNIACISSILH